MKPPESSVIPDPDAEMTMDITDRHTTVFTCQVQGCEWECTTYLDRLEHTERLAIGHQRQHVMAAEYYAKRGLTIDYGG